MKIVKSSKFYMIHLIISMKYEAECPIIYRLHSFPPPFPARSLIIAHPLKLHDALGYILFIFLNSMVVL